MIRRYIKNLPEIVYKFRCWSNPRHIQSLYNNSIYVPSPNDFNDPYDCNLPIIYKEKLTLENIYLWAHNTLNNSGLSLEQREQYAFERIDESRINDPTYIDEIEKVFYKIFCNDFGVYCASQEIENILLWAYYADSHKGFAIGYDTKELISAVPFRRGDIVTYEREIPQISIFDDHSEKFRVNTYFKSINWMHEKEYRFTLEMTNGKRGFELPKNAIKEIIFGFYFDQDLLHQTLVELSAIYPDTLFFKMDRDKSTFKLKKTLIYDPLKKLFSVCGDFGDIDHLNSE